MTIVIVTAVFALILAFALGTALGFFRQFFAVPEDPLASSIRAALPGANCGACGFPGCDGYAAALAKGSAEANRCSVGGPAVAARLSGILGVEAQVTKVVSVLACRGSRDKAPPRGEYTGLATCRGAKLSAGGTKLCPWGCAGFGDCVKVCKFGALSMGPSGIPVVDYSKCTGCKACVGECPQGLFRLIPSDQKGPVPLCGNRSQVRTTVAKACKAGCIKCELCVKNCPQKCLTMQNGLPAADYSRCTSCGICVAKCPVKVLRLAPQEGGDGTEAAGGGAKAPAA